MNEIHFKSAKDVRRATDIIRVFVPIAAQAQAVMNIRERVDLDSAGWSDEEYIRADGILREAKTDAEDEVEYGRQKDI
ncbi:MAG: hypothetical protein LUC22_01410 [Prevotella sp.]|nr:hypothetical protein [Prevotella sp.]